MQANLNYYPGGLIIMTAHITDIDRGAGADESRYDVYAYPYTEASPHKFSTAGQLWERVAEMGEAGVVNSPNYSARIADATRKVWLDGRYRKMGAAGVDARVCSAIVDCGRHLCFVGTLTARDMRAWRVGAARPYIAQHVHTGFECGAL